MLTNEVILRQETLYLTIYMVDKFLQTEGVAVKRNKLQLVGVAAMFTASKVDNGFPQFYLPLFSGQIVALFYLYSVL